jgi:hypothetical protein
MGMDIPLHTADLGETVKALGGDDFPMKIQQKMPANHFAMIWKNCVRCGDDGINFPSLSENKTRVYIYDGNRIFDNYSTFAISATIFGFETSNDCIIFFNMQTGPFTGITGINSYNKTSCVIFSILCITLNNQTITIISADDCNSWVLLTYVMKFLDAKHFGLYRINTNTGCTYHTKDTYIIFTVNVSRNYIRGLGTMDFEANRSNCGQETSTTATRRVRGRGDPDRSGPGSGDRKIKRSGRINSGSVI